MTHSERLASLNLTLPTVAAPVGAYVPATRTGRNVLTSGQLPVKDGKVMCAGKVPVDVSLEQAAQGAAHAVLNAVAAAAQVAGGLDKITRVVRMCVFVNSAPDFKDQPKVANGASDVLTKIFGDDGKHVRAAVGVSALPLGAAVEVELEVEAP